MNNSTITLCDLSGLLTLPMFNQLLSKTNDVRKLRELSKLLGFLYNHGQKQHAYQIICPCYYMTDISLPVEFAMLTREECAQNDYVGEVLADLNDILDEYE